VKRDEKELQMTKKKIRVALTAQPRKPEKRLRHIWVIDKECVRMDVSAWEDFNRICDILDGKRGQL
jgi:hypothetical protein